LPLTHTHTKATKQASESCKSFSRVSMDWQYDRKKINIIYDLQH